MIHYVPARGISPSNQPTTNPQNPMTLKPIAANQTEIEHNNGTTCFYSYSTLVAVFVTGKGAFVTSEHHSKTTSRHINKCLARWGAHLDGLTE